MPTASTGRLPKHLLCYTCVDGELVPAWFGDRDRPWLRDLIEHAHGLCGQPIGQLLHRWRDSEPDPRAGRRQSTAVHVLAGWLRRAADAPSMATVRRQLFELVAAGEQQASALQTVAKRHGLVGGELAERLFQDLPDHRLLAWPEPPPDPGGIILRANLALVGGMLRHARIATIAIHGGARAVLKTAWLLGICIEVDARDPQVVRLRWRRGDGVNAHRTLTSLLPLLPWTQRYHLRASCVIGHDHGDLVVATGDPLQPGPEPRLYDSQLEKAFARDFAAAMPRWLLVREPAAIATKHGLAFPDFGLQSREPAAPWLCEIAGLRNPTALEAKLELLDASRRTILCLPQTAIPGHFAQHPRIVPFRRRVPMAAVVAILNHAPSDTASR